MRTIKFKYIFNLIILTYLFSFNSASVFAASKNHILENVILQLKWKHQFQFAGYYAAIEKGYYQQAGFNVILHERTYTLDYIQEVVLRKAQFGIGTSQLLVANQAGKDIVVLAPIFQHAPEVLIAHKDDNILSPQSFVGKTIMFSKKLDAEIQAMLFKEGVPLNKINIIRNSWNIDDFINKKVDIIVGYITDLPYILNKRNVPHSIIRPQTYGIDFYGDCLFTSQREISEHPKRVAAFLKASLKGWDYAMQHQDEIVDLIIRKYNRSLSRERLLFEAKEMKKLMESDVIEIGHMNYDRWEYMAKTLAELKIIPLDYSLKKFLYNPKPDHTIIIRIIWSLLIGLIVIIIGIIILLLFNRKLNKEINIRTKQLSESSIFIDAIIKSLPGIFYVYEDGTRLIKWNKNMMIESGLSSDQLLNKHPLEWFKGEEKEKIKELLEKISQKGTGTIEAIIDFAKGPTPYYLTGMILEMNNKKYLIGLGIDLTSKKYLEEQLRQSQKMESIGRLAGGIAHDFNNILTTIIGYSELLLSELPEDNAYREEIEIIYSAGDRAATLTQQLLAFSRKQILQKKTVSLNLIIENFLKILSKMLGEYIEIKLYLEAVNDIIDADSGQIEQVLINLAVNASDAMLKGGELLFETKEVVFNKDYSEDHINIKKGKYVMLAVTDAGNGINKDIINHIFDPFFTTKEKGKGSGMGLSTVYGIIKQHNGHIFVYSEINQGTTFKIYFPASNKTFVPKIKENTKEILLVNGDETILVVDDAAPIRKLIIDTLEPLGYKCLEAPSGKAAIETVHNIKEEIHLLLTDVVMPGMNGKELSEEIIKEYSKIKILFMSGYTENMIAHHGVLDKDINYIAKPITPTLLTKKIREILDN